MTKIKLCGLSRPCDIEAANALLPDYFYAIQRLTESLHNAKLSSKIPKKIFLLLILMRKFLQFLRFLPLTVQNIS